MVRQNHDPGPGSDSNPDRPAATLENASAKRKPYAGTRISARVQPFEQAEHSLTVLRLDADAVIPDDDKPFAKTALGLDVDTWRFIIAVVFDAVSDQVLEESDKGRRISGSWIANLRLLLRRSRRDVHSL